MSATKAVFVLIHGAWHNHSVWDRVTPILKANGFAALTLDLPGAGVNAMAPASLRCSPFDPAAFAAERSPNAGVTQEERTQAVVALRKLRLEDLARCRAIISAAHGIARFR